MPATPAVVLAATAVTGSMLTGCSVGDAAGCGPAPTAKVSQADLYGSYSGPHGARLDLTAVGGTSVTFSVKDWPRKGGTEILAEDVPTFDGGGVWKLLNSPGQDGRVGLDFDGLAKHAGSAPVNELLVGKEDGHMVLFAKLGDPDVCRTFKLAR
ncbi:hypothetical protein [Streptomyces sp. NPDC048462]|uniref:hypothetical protein n=1 Tax=Streptomyces sp. NPDC048462 TaxID=3365555 RepID=UPI00371248BC